jgi:cytochrome b561
MIAMRDRAGYTGLQIVLHWVTVGLVVLQYLLHDGVVAAFDRGLESGTMAFTGAAVGHMAGGALILGIAIWRLLLRSEFPPPPPPAGEPAWATWLAPLVHLVFYLLLVALPFTGALAWGLASEFMGDLHEALRAALLFLIVAHVGAVILHQAVWKTGLIARMTRPLR